MSKKNDLEHTSTTLGNQNMKSSQRMASVVEPYELPEGWKWCRLGDFINIFRGVSYKKNDAHNEKQENDCLIIRGGNIDEGCINLNSDNVFVNKSLVSENQIIKKNDVIIVTSTGSIKVIGRAGVSASDYEDVAFGAFLTLARPNEKANKSFVNQYFQSSLYRERIRQLASGVNINNIRIEYITESPFPLPPTLAEQQRIVNRIESMFAKLDEAKEKAQNVVDGFETRKAAILHKAFTGELTAKWRKENGVSDDSWVEKTIGETMQLQAGKNISADKISLVQDNINKYPCFGGNGIRGYVDSYNKDGHFPIIGRQGALCGNLKYATGQFYATEHAVVVSCPSNIDSIWAYYTLGTMNLNQYATATAQPGLAVSNIVKISIPVPTLPEQVEIVRILDIIIEKENKAKQAAEAVLEQIDLLKKSILARAFRGEL